jgi:predicted secreted Zn-dependent protease
MSGAVPEPATWKKSTASNSSGCVEVAHDGPLTWVRDSKDPSGPRLSFNAREWEAFLTGVRANEFDRLTD